MPTLQTNTMPIKVWLRQPRLEVACRIVFHDRTTTAVGMDSPTIPAAQSEITAWLIEQGYQPAGPWTTEAVNTGETVRTFIRQGSSPARHAPASSFVQMRA